MEGMDTPVQQSDSRDLMHANFSAFQEQNLGRKTGNL